MADDDWDDDFEEDTGPYVLQPEDILARARCLYDFESTNEVELPLREGDIINVTRLDVGGGWLEGELNGQHGLFPESYVEVLAADDQGAAAPVSAVPQAASAAPPMASSVPRPGPGTSAADAPADACVILSGHVWQPSQEPFTLEVSAQEGKESKFGGLKKFTAYQICNTTTQATVMRRFKHFDWLHQRLVELYPCIVIPPLPEKQVSGRFSKNFVEYRRQKLERMLNRVALHPVLGASSVFRHFLTATDKKDWKSGKRQAEGEAKSGTFVQKVYQEELPPSDGREVISGFKTFHTWLEKQLTLIGDECDALLMQHHVAAEHLTKLADTMGKLGEAATRPSYAPWWEEQSPAEMDNMMDRMAYVGDNIRTLAAQIAEQEENDRRDFLGFLRHEQGLLKALQPVYKQHDHLYADYNSAQGKDGQVDQVDNLRQTCEKATSVVMAEMRHLHESLLNDIHASMKLHIENQVAYHQRLAAVWENLREQFP
ncbi:uncharacterized protein MONBRDRAFT_31764 [Monosiga brevicollis MX1]|uniref:Sorting nexin n=1 Tax=Monosiga brevicollis TaxID=81824 RepID=A9UUI4_MONBE|nr:uncharacterized protein MONBRDRAFT_31764 [Monosiga brevicollis MX1]EDQ90908.1 predicted protein [Monosiga brevicollis MX1]|eukprot:XP_001744205.1 hypothetical protein [Monosiga brevicollis MX1]